MQPVAVLSYSFFLVGLVNLVELLRELAKVLFRSLLCLLRFLDSGLLFLVHHLVDLLHVLDADCSAAPEGDTKCFFVSEYFAFAVLQAKGPTPTKEFLAKGFAWLEKLSA